MKRNTKTGRFSQELRDNHIAYIRKELKEKKQMTTIANEVCAKTGMAWSYIYRVVMSEKKRLV